jgi:hypothetical protein
MKYYLGVILLVCLAPSAFRGEGASTDKAPWFPLEPGHAWTYTLEYPTPHPLYFDPYYVNQPLLATSLTHGTTRRDREGRHLVELRVVERLSPTEARIELNDAGREFFFAPKVENLKIIVRESTAELPDNHPWNKRFAAAPNDYQPLRPFPTPLLAMELHGDMPMKDEPWILGLLVGVTSTQVLAEVDRGGWLAEPSPAVEVEAGRFENVVHARWPMGNESDTPRHHWESWTVPGTGLIKLTLFDANDKPFCTLSLKETQRP